MSVLSPELLRTLPTIDELDKDIAESYLSEFIRRSWSIVEPATRYINNWHIGAICDHLEAILRGDIQDLIINIPPRHMKSLTVSVFFPAFVWIKKDQVYNKDKPFNKQRTMSWIKFLYTSYADELSTRDSRKTRQLIQSPWYQERWGRDYRFVDDQNQKTRFENNKGGYRMSTTVDGGNTGEGGDIIVADDPNNVKKVESDTTRNSTNTWWRETMPTRRNNIESSAGFMSARIIMQQRSHDRDVTGYCLAEKLGYDHLVLPARYDPKIISYTKIGFEDPRVVERELLWPTRFGKKAQDDLESEMGSYAVAGQMQQSPHPRGGGLFKVDKFRKVDVFPADFKVVSTVFYFDKAGTEGGGAYTAGVGMHMFITPQGIKRFGIFDVVRGQWSFAARESQISQTMETYGAKVRYVVEQEPGSGGKESAERTVLNNAGFNVRAHPVGKSDGNKETRAQPYSASVEIGGVFVLVRDWTEAFLAEHESAPVGVTKDQWDSAAGAYNELTGKQKRVGVWGKKK